MTLFAGEFFFQRLYVVHWLLFHCSYYYQTSDSEVLVLTESHKSV